jgi:hypothetical protein
MSTVHKKTLNNLQLLMLKFNFVIEYKEGWRKSVADALSRTHAGFPLCVVTRSGRRTVDAPTHLAQERSARKPRRRRRLLLTGGDGLRRQRRYRVGDMRVH